MGFRRKAVQLELAPLFVLAPRRWSAGRWEKVVALLYFFNLPKALLCAAVSAYVGFLAALMIDDSILSKIPGIIQNEYPSMIDGTLSEFYQTDEALVPLVFVFVLFTCHWWWGKTADITLFLDMCAQKPRSSRKSTLEK